MPAAKENVNTREWCPQPSSSDFPFRHLNICINFLYEGIIRCSLTDKKVVYKALKHILGIRQSIKVVTWTETSQPSISLQPNITSPSPNTPLHIVKKRKEQLHSFHTNISKTASSINHPNITKESHEPQEKPAATNDRIAAMEQTQTNML